ncbi:hypothetical protein PABG_12309 [Paracoccidioides brasiliensis Pb03]|nr:hypothetical protein PABG_12309 [Paracoccidioides brasiliensis Pb03]
MRYSASQKKVLAVQQLVSNGFLHMNIGDGQIGEHFLAGKGESKHPWPEQEWGRGRGSGSGGESWLFRVLPCGAVGLWGCLLRESLGAKNESGSNHQTRINGENQAVGCGGDEI